MKLFAELRIFGFPGLSPELRRKVPQLFTKEDDVLVYRGHISSLTLSEWLKQMWPFVNHERDWIKTALRNGASGELYCYIKNLEEEVVLEPEALTVCTSLGLKLRISKRMERKPNQALDPTREARGSL